MAFRGQSCACVVWCVTESAVCPQQCHKVIALGGRIQRACVMSQSSGKHAETI